MDCIVLHIQAVFLSSLERNLNTLLEIKYFTKTKAFHN